MARTPTQVLAKAIKKIGGALNNFDDGVVPSLGAGVPFCFGDSIDLLTTDLQANDVTHLMKCPAGAYIWAFRGDPSDLDTNATPVIVYDIVTVDVDDNVQDTLVSGSTAGQAGATFDTLTAAQIGGFVGDRWIAIKVTTSAGTAAAGTYKFTCQLSIGILTYAGGIKPYMLDAAV